MCVCVCVCVELSDKSALWDFLNHFSMPSFMLKVRGGKKANLFTVFTLNEKIDGQAATDTISCLAAVWRVEKTVHGPDHFRNPDRTVSVGTELRQWNCWCGVRMYVSHCARLGRVGQIGAEPWSHVPEG